MAQPKVVISYRFTRADTTGIHCQEALQDIIGKENVTFIDPRKFDTILEPPKSELYIAIDDDSVWRFPAEWGVEGQRAVWFIDTHTDFEKRMIRARNFDFIFTAQLRGARGLSESKRDDQSVKWLPLACNPKSHRYIPIENRTSNWEKYAWSFVGHAPKDRWLPINRAVCLELLAKHHQPFFYGNAYDDSMMQVYSSSTVTFNRAIVDDMNMRVFEAMASGRALITNDVEGLRRLFVPDKHLFVFSGQKSFEDEKKNLLSVMEFCQDPDHADFVDAVSMTGMETVHQYHTYEVRMREMLMETIGYDDGGVRMDYNRNIEQDPEYSPDSENLAQEEIRS